MRITGGRGFQLLLLTIAAFGGAYARSLLGPLQETIRTALTLTDNQMALLQGPILSLPVVIGIIPFGIVIDRVVRVRLLVILTILNVIGAALTAAASTFPILMIGRCVAGFSAFAVNPVVLSLFGDFYAPAERGRAVMAMAVGQNGGMAAAFGLGGFLLTAFGSDPTGWRWTLLWMTCPLIFVVLMMYAAAEPRRIGVSHKNLAIRDAFQGLWRLRPLVVPLLVGILTAEIAIGAVNIWAAPILSRRFGLPADRVGTIMAAALLFSGVLGQVVGGMLADFCQRTGGPRRTLSVVFWMTLIGAPAVLFARVPDVTSASALLVLYLAISNSICAMAVTMFIVIVPNELRGLCLGILTAAVVLVGNGLAPLAVSLLSSTTGGPATIGEALGIIGLASNAVGAIAFVFGRRSFPAIPERYADAATR